MSNNPTGLGLGGINNNSPTYAGRVAVAAAGSSLGFSTGQLTLIDLSAPGSALNPATSYRAFDGPATGGAGTDPDRFNFRAYTPAIPRQEFAKYFVTGGIKIFGDGLQIYGDVMYSHTQQDNGLAAAPFALSAAVSQSSPYNPFGTALTQTRYRFVNDLGPRRSYFDTEYQRYTVGFNGDFNFKDNGFISRFGYDTGFVYEYYVQERVDSGDGQFTPLTGEIAAGNFNPFIGQNAPVSGVAPIYTTNAGGQPVPAGTQAFDNAAAAQRVSYIGHSFTYEDDYLIDVRTNAHLFPNLWNGGIDIAAGYENRELRQHSVPDPVQANGDQLGFNQAPNTKTTQKVNSIFGEINIPFVTSTNNITFVRSFEVDFAYRYEWFTDTDQFNKQNEASFNNGGTPRVTVRWQPIADITLRGSYGESFLSPTPLNLFLPVAQNFPVVFDPVNRVTLQPGEGVWQGGNPALTPELTKSWTAGVVWTPKYLPGFTMTADWYQIYTTNLILPAANAAQVLLTQGVLDTDGYGNGSGTVDGPGGTANGITRDEFGNLVAIDADIANAGTRFVQGLDVTAVYEMPTQHWGTFTASGGWNHFFDWKAQPGVGASHDFLGDFSATFPLAPGAVPFNKFFVRGEWQWRGWDFIATMNYIGDYQDDPNFILGNELVPGSPGTGDIPPSNNPSFVLNRTVTSYITLDMQLSYEWKKPEMAPVVAGYSKDAKDAKSTPVAAVDNGTFWQRMLWNTKITVGVNNAFDREPPTTLGAFNDNYDTSLYSIRDRYWYISLSKKF